MFDLDISKMIIVGIVALAVIPPKDLPRVMRTVGQTVGKMRRMAAEFQGQFMEAMREVEREADLDSVKKEFQAISDQAKIDTSFDPVGMVRDDVDQGGRDRRSSSARAALGSRSPPSLRSAGSVAKSPVHDRARLGRRPRSWPSPSRGSGSRARGARRPEKRGGMSQEDIDATKAPLMDHLIELRARIIRSLYAFLAAFIVCFYFSRTIYNILT